MRNIHPSIKLLIVPLWFVLSSVFLITTVWLVSYEDGVVSTQVVESNQIQTAQPSYNLYAALPKKGDVLGQQVEYADIRVLKLKGFLRFYHSPMVEVASEFIEIADRYQLPWNLLPAIACKESGCGRVLPYGSYNPFGWAIYTGENSGAVFTSWEEGIERVARGLREDYFNRGFDTVEKIETRYTPQSARTHNGWQIGVNFFMDEMENWELGRTN